MLSGPLKLPFDPCVLAVPVCNQWITGTQRMRRMEDCRGTSWSSDYKGKLRAAQWGFQIAFLYPRVSSGEKGQDSRIPASTRAALLLAASHTGCLGRILFEHRNSWLRKVWKSLGMEQSPRCQVPQLLNSPHS